MSVRLTLICRPEASVSLAGMAPAAVCPLTSDAALAFPLAESLWPRKSRLGDWFGWDRIDDQRDDRLIVSGDLSLFDDIGAGLANGSMLIDGAAGDRVGLGMSGGEIEVTGSVGDEAALAMSGGLLTIHGNAGRRLAAAFPGQRHGMTGGEVIVRGAAGDDVAPRMRRGLVAIGACGDFPGTNMRSGTLVVAGACGRFPGANMVRGTIILAGESAPELPATFLPGATTLPPFFPMLARRLAQLDGSGDWTDVFDGRWQVFHGDMLRAGRGEVFVRTRQARSASK